MITTKKHNKIVNELSEEIVMLRDKLSKANDLKSIVDKLSDKIIKFGEGYLTCGSGLSLSWSDTAHLNLGEDVLVYVPDYFGGKVIKQEATKVIHITKDGEVKTGVTKKSADKGFTYLLQRDEK